MTATREAPKPIIDPSNPNLLQWPDLGLTLILDFVTEAEEAALIADFHARHPARDGRRRVSQHYGHHFDYATFRASETDFTPVPAHIAGLLPRLPRLPRPPGGTDEPPPPPPDQFTVQYYPPGTGIPPHVDTHSAFGEALYSLSLGSAVPMQFRRAGASDARRMRLPKRSVQDGRAAGGAAGPQEMLKAEEEEEQQEAWELLLPARSLLVMTGASRYGYTHGIRARKTDVVDGGRAVVPRRGRYSVTMRSVRRGADVGCACAYPGVCDARIREEQEREQGREREREQAREAEEAVAMAAARRGSDGVGDDQAGGAA